MPFAPWPAASARNIDAVGYHDLGKKPGFKLAIQERDERWYLYVSHFWHSGWSVLDVTDPSDPQYASFVEGPPNTFTLQVQVADGLMIGSLQEIYIAGWGGAESTPFDEGVLLWDVATDPAAPRLLSQWKTGAKGTHRNFYNGGSYAHLSASIPGLHGHGYRIIDVSDPTAPAEVGSWSLPEQADPPGPNGPHLHLHGPAHVEGDRAYLPYSGGGMVILDISDVTAPRLVSRLSVHPGLGGKYGVHTVIPLLDRGLAIVNSEMVRDNCEGPLPIAAMVDISDEAHPFITSIFPVPRPTADEPYANYCEKGGWFGPHNQHHAQGSPFLESRSDRVYLTYFNAGLRVFDIANPRDPVEIAHFVPADPVERLGPAPSKLAVSSEDVLVDRRGFVYLTDKNLGVQILRARV